MGKDELIKLACVLNLIPICVSTDKALKETLDKMLLSGYFDRTQTHQNGVCEEETRTVAVEPQETEDHPAEPGKNKINLQSQ